MAKSGGKRKRGAEVELTTLEWLENYSEVKYWLQDIRGGEAHESTKTIFAGCLRKYCEFRGMTPEELLDEGEADLRRGRKEKVVKQHLIDFREHLKEGGRGASTVTTHMTAIRSFFNSHDVPLPKLSNGNREAEHLKHEFDREKVRDLVNACNPRDRAIFLTMFQSGLAANEIANLRIKDLKELTKDGITVLTLRREKNNGHWFTTFIGRDARRAIDEYLRIRNEGKLLRTRPNVSKDATVKGEDDYVFVNYDQNHNQWNKLIPSKISVYMRQVCEKLGWFDEKFDSKRGKRSFNPYRPHALRASFATILNNGGVPKNFVDHMLGHKQSATDEAYFKQHSEKLYEYYKKSEYLLSISDLEKVPDSRYEELMIALRKRNGEIEKLREEIEAMKARDRERAPYDETMAEVMRRLLDNPEMKVWIKKELEKIKK